MRSRRVSTLGWVLPIGVTVSVACGAPMRGSPPGVGALSPAVPPASDGRQAASFEFSFERGLDGFSVLRGRAAPVCEPVDASRLAEPGAKGPVTLNPPGNYWRTPIDVGQVGACRVDTGWPEHVATELVSPRLAIKARYLSFRIGGDRAGGAAVELRSESTGQVLRSEPPPDTVAMARVTWDLQDLVGQSVRLVIRDEAHGAHGLLVDDIFDSAERPPDRPAPLWGFADLHSHPLSQLGFGSHLFFGKNDGNIEQALGSCEHEHGENGMGGSAGFLTPLFEKSPNRTLGHRTTGYPAFDGWPLWSTQMHQQMYVNWIERAWRGGLRLMVAHVVNNEQLADSFHGARAYDDVSVTTAELEGIKAFVGRHPDFMEVAYTAADARRIITSKRLAVVLGVEVDSLGNCRRDDDCTEAQIRAEIRRLYALGARHVFPVHLADNALGGTAVYKNQVFNLLTWFLRGTYQHVEHDASVDYYYRPLTQEAPVWLREGLPRANLYGNSLFFPPFEDYAAARPGHINSRGLTELGVAALDEMMKLGILIDIDHMGQNSRADSIRMAASHAPPVPLVMGHTTLRELGFGPSRTSDIEKYRHEAAKAPDEIEAVRALGGVVAPITFQGDVRRASVAGDVPECAGSSASWVQAYAYLVDHMGETGVGMGTDFNGFAQEPLPRFGPTACFERRKAAGGEDRLRRNLGRTMRETLRDDANAQRGGVSYEEGTLVYAKQVRFLGAEGRGAYSDEERDIWNGIACFEAHANPRQLGLDRRALANVEDVVAGLGDKKAVAGRPLRRAAFLAKRTNAPRPTDEATAKAYDEVRDIYLLWKQMEGGNLGEPLERYVVPADHAVRDFDVNLDGLAHYGLLPDFLQDVSNQLGQGQGPVHDLRSLFRSVESYVRMWELVEAAKAAAPADAHD